MTEEIRREYCESRGIHINRRITGGGAIFFDESQLGWEIISDKAFFNVKIPTNRLFRTLCEPVVTALAEFGLASLPEGLSLLRAIPHVRGAPD